MATRRNTRDLIRQEGQKLNPKPADAAEASNGSEPVESNTPEASETEDMANSTPAKRTTTTKADLDTTVMELKAKLEEATKRENSLQEQITTLQADLFDQKTHVEKLEQANLKVELEDAKKTALKLAEANSKLTAEVNALKKENQELKAKGHIRPVETHAEEVTKKAADFAKTSWLL
jgi:chromosome segregation ATPase